MARVTAREQSIASLEPELRLSPAAVIVSLLALGVVLFLATERLANAPLRGQAQSLVLLFDGAAGVAWLLLTWRPPVGRWFMVITLAGLIDLTSTYLRTPQIQSIQVVPVVLAWALGGLPAAAVAALLATAFLVWPALAHSATGIEAAAYLAAVWAVFCLLYATDRRVQRVVEWAWGYFQRAQGLLDETRDRKAALEQALGDLAHANRQLALANERAATLRLIAEEAQKSKAEFVARVSHEFRTPLNMIIGLVGLMVETPDIYAEELPPELAKDLEIVHRNCEHLASMVNDVLDLSRVEAGRLTLHREPVDLAETIRGVAEVVRPLIEKKQLYLRVALADDLSIVQCDRMRIRQVLLNLVSNAARFTARGGITVQASRQGKQVHIAVSDTGAGIPPENAQRVFEPFWQAPSGVWQERSGSGLGLSICKQLVELHGGRIWVESEVGVGTAFHVELPIAAQPEHARRPVLWIKEDWVWREAAFKGARTAATEQLTRPRVLICDSRGSLFSECVRYADEAEFAEARNLPAALSALAECPAHAVLLNAASVGELAQAADVLRRASPTTPIVGGIVARPVTRAEEAGALGYLVKPVTHSDIARALRMAGSAVKRVLIIDDDPEVCRLLTRMLHACDGSLEVITASCGATALECLAEAPPDLALLDIVLPDITGWEVLEHMRHNERLWAVPVFVVSAQDPVDQPPLSECLFAALGDGLTVRRLLSCTLALSSVLLSPD